MVERRIELDRRYTRKKKMKKLKAKLESASGAEREKVMYKIRRLSPFWTEPAQADAPAPAAKAPEKKPASKKK
jgi:acetylornithine deacetylase/succinyl-diaminopimelate desuccinylase-like protein